MSKLTSGLILATLAATVSVGADAAILGPEAAACAAGAERPAILVKVEGLKTRTGNVRVQSYGGDPAHYFDKGSYLRRIDVAVPASGSVEICLPVPAPGNYAVSVRHDVDGSGKTTRADGGGMSGNPELSLWDVIFKRKPEPKAVQVTVRGVVKVPVVMNYVQGSKFGPIALASR